MCRAKEDKQSRESTKQQRTVLIMMMVVPVREKSRR